MTRNNIDKTLQLSENLDRIQSFSNWLAVKVLAASSTDLEKEDTIVAVRMRIVDSTNDPEELMIKASQYKELQENQLKWTRFLNTNVRILADYKRQKTTNDEPIVIDEEERKDGIDFSSLDVTMIEPRETVVRYLEGIQKDKEHVAEFLDTDPTNITTIKIPVVPGDDHHYVFVIWTCTKTMQQVMAEANLKKHGTVGYRVDDSEYDTAATLTIGGLTNGDEMLTLDAIRLALDRIAETHNVKFIPKRAFASALITDLSDKRRFDNRKYNHVDAEGLEIVCMIKTNTRREPKSHIELTCVGLHQIMITTDNLEKFKEVIEKQTNAVVLYIEPGIGAEQDRFHVALNCWEATKKILKTNPQFPNCQTTWVLSRYVTREHSLRNIIKANKSQKVSNEVQATGKAVTELRQEFHKIARHFSTTITTLSKDFQQGMKEMDKKFSQKAEAQQNQLMALMMHQIKSINDKKLGLLLAIQNNNSDMKMLKFCCRGDEDAKQEIEELKQITESLQQQVKELEEEENRIFTELQQQQTAIGNTSRMALNDKRGTKRKANKEIQRKNQDEMDLTSEEQDSNNEQQ
jgi:hypothetical protein